MNICAAAVHVVPTPVASFLPGVNLCLVLGSGDRTPTPSPQAAPVSVLCCEAPWIKAPNVRWVSPLIYKEWGLYLPTHTHTHTACLKQFLILTGEQQQTVGFTVLSLSSVRWWTRVRGQLDLG